MNSIRDYLFGGYTRQLLYKSLDAGALRSKAISENLANVDTPGYKRKEVNFEEQLQDIFKKKLAGTTDQPGQMDISLGADLQKVKPFAYEPVDDSQPSGVNNVDVDMEAAKMAENQILYNFGIKFASFDKMNSAILGRG